MKMINKIKLVIISFFIIANVSYAQQPGILDLTYNSSDLGLNTGDGASSTIRASIAQPDGKIIIAGDFTSFNSITGQNRIIRLNSDGSIDPTFNTGTGANGIIYAIALQSDGKIVIGGEFKTINAVSRTRVARLNSDGSLDVTFNPSSGADSTVFSIALTSSEKVVIGGLFSNVNGVGRNRIALLGSNGSLDLSLDPGTGAGGTSNAIRTCLVDASDKIIISGDFTLYNGTVRNRIARINIDGSLDLTFNPGTAANNIIYTTVLQSDGKIIIGGSFTNYAGTSRSRIARINSNGTIDGTFTPGTGANSNVRALAIQADGKIVLGGQFTLFNGTSVTRIIRVNSNGTVDGTFSSGLGTNNTILALNVLASGKILFGGSFTSYNNFYSARIGQLNSDGTFDATFNTSTGASSNIRSIALQPDGKAIIAGDFLAYNGLAINRIARVNTDGSIDLSFNPGTGANNPIYSVFIQSDGKIIISGQFTSFNGTTRNRIARLNNDGSLDFSFDPGVGPNSTVLASALLPNGKIVIGGQFTSVDGASRNYIAQLNSDGTHDLSFDPGSGAINNVRGIAVNSMGKILAVGDFTLFHGSANNRIVQLNADGSIDPSFSSGTAANNIIYSIALQSDDKILIGGAFTNYNGTARNRIARINTNGTIDATFTPGTAANSNVRSIAIQSDGKIIIAGQFTTFAGNSRARIARLNSSGVLDALFIPGTGANNTILTSALQNDGELLVGGQFNVYNGVGRNRLARVIAVCTPPTINAVSSASVCGSGSGTLSANASSGTINWYTLPTGGTTLNTGNSFVTPSQSVTTTYYVDATNICTTNTRTPVSLVVNSIPSVSISSSNTVCTGASVVLTASGANTYTWNTGVNFTSLNVTPSVNTTYTLTGTSVAGCVNSAVKTISVVSCDGTVGTNLTYCNITTRNFSYPLYANAVSGATQYQFKFYKTSDNSLASTVTVPTRSLNLSQVSNLFYGNSYRWTVAVINENGTGPESGQNCVINILEPSLTVPCGRVISNLNTPVLSTSAARVSYRFTIYDALTDALVAVRNQTTNYLYMNQIPGANYGKTYKYTVAAGYNNGTTTVFATPSSSLCTISIGEPTTSVPCSRTYTTTNGIGAISPISGAVNYKYNFYNISSSSLVGTKTFTTNYFYLNQVSGIAINNSYYWTVQVGYNDGGTVVYGPESASNCMVTWGSSPMGRVFDPEEIEDSNSIENSLIVSIYPNPNNGQFTIDLPQEADVIIMDALGKEVLNHRFSAGKQELGLENIENGIYFINAIVGEEKIIHKMIINK